MVWNFFSTSDIYGFRKVPSECNILFVNRATLKENEDYNEFKRLGLLLKKHYSNPINYEL